MSPHHPRLHRRVLRHQRGIASLIIVAVLFLIVSLVAAYTNRNLIFEQRTSVNQHRSTLAFEAAEAGVEWALSMLNGSRIDENCLPSTDATSTSFRQRYLSIADDTGRVTPTGTLTAAGESTVWPSCVFNEGAWSCSCPAPGSAPDLDLPTDGSSPHPAFRVRFVRLTSNPVPAGAVRLEVNGCTRLQNDCLDFPATGVSGEGRASIRVVVALRGGLAAPPVAALTVRGNLDVGGSLSVYNGRSDSGGIALLTGGVVSDPSGTLFIGSAPGGPPAAAQVTEDAGLAALSSDRMFASTFATWPDVWRDQPGARRLDCTNAGCDGDDLREALLLHPGHVVWVDGNLSIDGAGEIGTAAQPVVVVVNGDVTSIDSGTTLNGLLYVRSAAWLSGGEGLVRGAVIAENAMSGTGGFDVLHDPDILRRARWQTGTFVRAPGGWRDF